MTSVLTNLFDGVAYGMLLFVLACGLSITLGLMNFINLAHGAFAMAGGYCTVVIVNRLGVPFALGLPIAFLITAALGALFGRRRWIDNLLDRLRGEFLSAQPPAGLSYWSRFRLELQPKLDQPADGFGAVRPICPKRVRRRR